MRPALPTCALGTTIPRTRKIRQIASGAGMVADLNPDLSFVRGHYSVGIPGCSTRIAPDCYIRVNSVGDYTGALTGTSGRSLQSWWGFQFKDAGSFQNGEPVVTRLSRRGTRWPAFPTESAWICFGARADTAPAHYSSQAATHFFETCPPLQPEGQEASTFNDSARSTPQSPMATGSNAGVEYRQSPKLWTEAPGLDQS